VVVHAAYHAQALRLSFVVQRRTGLGSTGHPGDVGLGRAAVIMGRARRWTEERQAEEIAGVRIRYLIPPRMP
jgi:hypothetical protein